MKIEEAIEILKLWNKDLSEFEDEKEGIECHCLAISALEKQIPKKPTDICTPVVTWGLCPVCKGELSKLGGKPNRVFEGTACCPDCGQALDWSEET